jgi:hypothetical protein
MPTPEGWTIQVEDTLLVTKGSSPAALDVESDALSVEFSEEA